MLLYANTQRVELRISPASGEMIQAVAQAQNKAVSELMLDRRLNSAPETLADRRQFIFDVTQLKLFNSSTMLTPRERPHLTRLLTTGR